MGENDLSGLLILVPDLSLGHACGITVRPLNVAFELYKIFGKPRHGNGGELRARRSKNPDFFKHRKFGHGHIIARNVVQRQDKIVGNIVRAETPPRFRRRCALSSLCVKNLDLGIGYGATIQRQGRGYRRRQFFIPSR